MAMDRVTVQEAARRLGVKDDAIRKRIQRGSLEHDKGEDGRVYVYLEPSSAVAGDARGGEAAQDASYDALLVGLQDQVSYLRSVLREERDARRRADTIIAQLTHTNTQLSNRVLELDAPARSTQASEPSEEAAQDTANGAPGPRPPADDTEAQNGSGRVSWWRRVFGG